MSDLPPSPLRPSTVRLSVPASHGNLEALLQEPLHASAASVLCHPHPLHGGTMRNNAVHRAAAALSAAGVAVLRFNFRGVGRSTGAWSEGAGEEDDARFAASFLEDRFPDLPLWMAGFSFGARIALRVGAEMDPAAALLGIGLPLRMYDFGFLDRGTKPVAIVQAENDEFGSAAEVRRLCERWGARCDVQIVAAAGHLFTGKLDELQRSVAAAIAFLRSAPGSSPPRRQGRPP